FALAVIFCITVAIYPESDLIKDISNLGLPAVSYIVIRLVDAALVIVLVPVLWLYVQYLKSHQKQSLTFAFQIPVYANFCAFDET
ncbi:MAG: hypothetical protein JSV51_03630, partial [Candidatus Bathyarchaeota archaeon]